MQDIATRHNYHPKLQHVSPQHVSITCHILTSLLRPGTCNWTTGTIILKLLTNYFGRNLCPGTKALPAVHLTPRRHTPHSTRLCWRVRYGDLGGSKCLKCSKHWIEAECIVRCLGVTAVYHNKPLLGTRQGHTHLIQRCHLRHRNKEVCHVSPSCQPLSRAPAAPCTKPHTTPHTT